MNEKDEQWEATVVTKVLLVLPHGGALHGVGVGLQDPGMVPLQVLALCGLDGHLIIVAELQQEVDRSVAAAGHCGLAPHHPVLSSAICGGEESTGLR